LTELSVVQEAVAALGVIIEWLAFAGGGVYDASYLGIW